MPLLPSAISALHASHAGIWLADSDGRTRELTRGEAISLAADTPLILLNAPLVANRLGYPELSGLDLLELFAFVHPARFAVPTAQGMARALGVHVADTGAQADIPRLLLAMGEKLLATLSMPDWGEREGAWTSVGALSRARWPWASMVTQQLPRPEHAERWLFSKLPEWEETAPAPPPRQVHLDPQMVRDQLDALTGHGAERRQGQQDYAEAAASIFAPREKGKAPHMLLAEAGTGIGKTLGYLAPASLWAADADGTVWLSTFTKALQRQLARETQRIYPDPEIAKHKVVLRKGRENYLCLLNLEDAMQGGFAGRPAILAHLVARWAAYTRDGDMIGGDLPGWLGTLFRQRGIASLTDRRGECVYAGCPHYRKCFIERAQRASRDADLVIANHALVMVNAARGREGDARPTRVVFDEGHHLHHAADSMFSAALTGQEAIELRRWVLGPEKSGRGRRRGLSARLSDFASYDEEAGNAIEAARQAASDLPGDGWIARLSEGAPFGPLEHLLAGVRGAVYGRDESGGEDAGYGLEAEIDQLPGDLIDLASEAAKALEALLKPLIALSKRLETLIEEGPDWMDGPSRARAEGALGALGWRSELIAAWIALLARLGGPVDPDFVDWMAVDRADGREYDIGLRRHYLDPMKAFAATVLEPAHGVMVTSATLRDGDDWATARAQTGADHLEARIGEFAVNSPFDYARQAEVLIVTDIKRGDMAGLAGAYAQIIEASGGGVLGLFTAIKRLRAVHHRIADRLAREGLPLFAQHVDPIDTGTLVDIFRDDMRASLLGTDALRDGVDVPGHSLRCVVMEGVPWPKPSILHRARRLAEGQKHYDDRIIRARLAQAFGRLIRHGNDKGHFIVLSAAFPSRLLTAFPIGTPVRRITLDEALLAVRKGFADTGYAKIAHHAGNG